MNHPGKERRLRALLQHGPWSAQLEKGLEQLRMTVNTRLVCRVLKSQPDARLAVMFFRWAARQGNYRHNVFTYTRLIHVLGSVKAFRAIWLLIDLMRREGLQVTDAPFNALIRSYGVAGMAKEAHATMLHMKTVDCEPTGETYKAVFHSFVKAFDFCGAREICLQMLHLGFSPDTITFDSFIRNSCKANKVDCVIELLDIMERKHGYVPKTSLINVILQSLCSAHRTAKAHKFLTDMMEKGCTLDVVTYTTLLHGLVQDNNFGEAVQLFHEMRNKGFDPDLVSYNVMVHAFCKAGRLDQAIGLLNDMEGRHCPPSIVTYNSLCRGCFRDGRVDDALNMVEKMLDQGCVPDKVTYTTLLHGLCNAMDPDSGATFDTVIAALTKDGLAQEAVSILDEVLHGFSAANNGTVPSGLVRGFKLLRKIADKGFVFDIWTYNILISGLCKAGRLDRARSLLAKMVERGYTPDAISYCTLMNQLCKVGKLDEASTLFQEMVKSGCTPDDVTYNLLISWFIKESKVENALKLLEEMVDLGYAPNTVTYTSLLGSLLNSGKTDKARSILRDMLNRGCSLNSVTYNTLLEWYRKEGKVHEAVKVLDEMLQKGYAPTIQNSGTLLKWLCEENCLDDALRLFDEIINKGIVADKDAYSLLIDHLNKAGRFDKAQSLSSQLISCTNLDQIIAESQSFQEFEKRVSQQGVL